MTTEHWIKDYATYINDYILCEGTHPGEHHFVALYLMPRVISIVHEVSNRPLSDCLPDFVNPDGTKKRTEQDWPLDDLVYYARDRTPPFSMEVKLSSDPSFNFTEKQWKHGRSAPEHRFFCGVWREGILLAPLHDVMNSDLVRDVKFTGKHGRRRTWAIRFNELWDHLKGGLDIVRGDVPNGGEGEEAVMAFLNKHMGAPDST